MTDAPGYYWIKNSEGDFIVAYYDGRDYEFTGWETPISSDQLAKDGNTVIVRIEEPRQ